MNTSLLALKKNKILFYLLVSCALLFPALLFAADPYIPLEGIPGLPTGGGGLPQYLNSVYKLLIVVGAMIACVKIIIAGVKWSMSGIVTEKSDAKHDIQGSLLGLAILLIPYIVLITINPNLVSMDILKGADEVKMDLIVSPGTTVTQSATNNEARRLCEQSRRVYNTSTGSCTNPDDGSSDRAENIRLCERSGGNYNTETNVCTAGISSSNPYGDPNRVIPPGSYDYNTGDFTEAVLQGWITYCGGATYINVLTLPDNKTRLSCK